MRPATAFTAGGLSEGAMGEFTFEDRDGHILLRLGEKVALLDTGSPVTIANEPFEFLGQTRTVLAAIGEVSIDSVRSLAGFEFDIILGNDILSRQDLLIRGREKVLVFGKRLELDGEAIEIDFVQGIPAFPLRLDGTPGSALLDTGACLSYVLSERVSGARAIGEYRDFFPPFGRYTGAAYEFGVCLNGHAANIKFGVLPPEHEPKLAAILRMAGADCIAGNAFFGQWDCLVSWSGRRIVWRR